MKRLISSKFYWILGLVLSLAGGYFFLSTHRTPLENYGKVERADLTQQVTIAGTVNPNRKTVISAPYNGYVKKLYVQVGENVQAGDPIVSVAQSLRSSDGDVYPLRAPFTGTVVQVLRTEGEYVDTTTAGTLVRIDDLTRLFIDASAPEIEVSKLKVDQQVLIKASAILSHPYHGKIRHISLAAREQKDWDKSRVEFSVQLEVQDPDRFLKPGMSVVADIITHKLTQVLTLKHEFIQKDGNQYFVITSTGVKKNIEVGLQNEEVFEITQGLNEGEQIQVADFLSTLKDH